MLQAQCVPDRNIAGPHQQFLLTIPRDEFGELPRNDRGEVVADVPDFRRLAEDVLGWEPTDLVEIPPDAPLPPEQQTLEVWLQQYGQRLRPDYAVPSGLAADDPSGDTATWQMLVRELPPGTPLDKNDGPIPKLIGTRPRRPSSNASSARPAFRSGCCPTAPTYDWSTPPAASRPGTSPSRSAR